MGPSQGGGTHCMLCGQQAQLHTHVHMYGYVDIAHIHLAKPFSNPVTSDTPVGLGVLELAKLGLELVRHTAGNIAGGTILGVHIWVSIDLGNDLGSPSGAKPPLGQLVGRHTRGSSKGYCNKSN